MIQVTGGLHVNSKNVHRVKTLLVGMAMKLVEIVLVGGHVTTLMDCVNVFLAILVTDVPISWQWCDFRRLKKILYIYIASFVCP